MTAGGCGCAGCTTLLSLYWLHENDGRKMTELGDILREDTEQDSWHVHRWALRKAQPEPLPFAVLGQSRPFTRVMGQCTGCGWPMTWVLAGEWSLADITGQAAAVSGQPADITGQPS
jgi:hypothetical protein